MGILDLFKKKKTEAKPGAIQTNNNRQTTSYSPSRQSSTTIVPISEMINFGLEWREKYLANYAVRQDTGTRVEALLYSCWFAWYNCLQQGKVSREQSYVNEFFAHLIAHLQDDDIRFEDVDFFMPLFKNRYSFFKDDLTGLMNSHYPETKQYLPIRTYKAFCLRPTDILAPSEASFSSLSMEQDDEMTSFVGKLIRFINDMNIDANNRF